MLPFHRLRALITAIITELPGPITLPPPEAVAARCAALAASRPETVILQTIGQSRAGTPLQALQIGPEGAPTLLLVGVPHGDAPLGAATLLALAHYLAAYPAILDTLRVCWWLVPCADPDGARRNAPWYTTPPSFARYMRELMSPRPEALDDPAGAPLPAMAALQRLGAAVAPTTTLLLYDAPLGGVALFTQRERAPIGSARTDRPGDFARLVDLLGLPLDCGGALGPLTRATAPGRYTLPEASVPQDTIEECLSHFSLGANIEAGLALLARGTTTGDTIQRHVGGVVVPRLIDYARRERDQTPSGQSRRAVTEAGMRLWREWFAFGRTALDLVQPMLVRAKLSDSPLAQAVTAMVEDGAAIMTEGSRWASELPRPEEPATIAEEFAFGDAIRAARLPRLAALVRLLDNACERLGPAASLILTETRDRTAETRDRWIDELAGGGDFRPVPTERAIGAQLGAILLARPAGR